MPGCRCRRCVPWRAIVIPSLFPPNGGAVSGSKGSLGLLGLDIYAQLATSVRPLACCSSSAAFLGVSASRRQRSLSLQSQCSMHPQRREVHSCGRGYANAWQRLSTFSGHAKVLLTAARLVARAHIRGPGQPPLKSPKDPSHLMHSTSSGLHAK